MVLEPVLGLKTEHIELRCEPRRPLLLPLCRLNIFTTIIVVFHIHILFFVVFTDSTHEEEEISFVFGFTPLIEKLEISPESASNELNIDINMIAVAEKLRQLFGRNEN